MRRPTVSRELRTLIKTTMKVNRALTFGFGGYADLDLILGEFFNANHTVDERQRLE
jgi:hypothetical protein